MAERERLGPGRKRRRTKAEGGGVCFQRKGKLAGSFFFFLVGEGSVRGVVFGW